MHKHIMVLESAPEQVLQVPGLRNILVSARICREKRSASRMCRHNLRCNCKTRPWKGLAPSLTPVSQKSNNHSTVQTSPGHPCTLPSNPQTIKHLLSAAYRCQNFTKKATKGLSQMGADHQHLLTMGEIAARIFRFTERCQP